MLPSRWRIAPTRVVAGVPGMGAIVAAAARIAQVLARVLIGSWLGMARFMAAKARETRPLHGLGRFGPIWRWFWGGCAPGAAKRPAPRAGRLVRIVMRTCGSRSPRGGPGRSSLEVEDHID